MKCPENKLERIRCNQLLDIAEQLVNEQGVVSFRFSQISKVSGCSTNTLYKYFSSKEDVLVCLFLRSTTSCHIPIFLNKNKELNPYQKVLLPILFTFVAVKNNPVFNILRVVSINSMFWQMASDEKVEILKKRVNLFWSHLYNPLIDARNKKILLASDKDILELTQSIYFFLAGAISSYESKLMDSKYLPGSLDDCYKHLSKIYNQYQWREPITTELIKELDHNVKIFFEQGYDKYRSCDICLQTSEKFNNNFQHEII